MNLAGKRILLTGASGGIGQEVALRLGERRARIALVGRDHSRLGLVAEAVRARGGEAILVRGDLGEPGAAESVVDEAARALGGLDVIALVAGQVSFSPFDDEDPETVDRMFRVNLLAPVRMVRAALPRLRAAGSARIVLVGSIFGSIGFPWFATYSATKFGLRGFAEALRRELHGTGVGVTYVAPRATRTPMAVAFERMAAAVKMNMDPPAHVAARVVDAIESDASDRYLGFPESLFVRVNALLPRLVDRALRGQSRAMRPFAEEAASGTVPVAVSPASPAPVTSPSPWRTAP